MSGMDAGSLKLMQSALNYSNNLTNRLNSSNNAVGGSKKGVYAEKGDPFYKKEMDKNEDGVVTFEEFQEYCLENDISASEMKQMLKDRLNYQINNETERASSEIKEIKSDSDAVYAKEGDDKYDEAIDENRDGKITYEEYMKYCEEQEKDTSSEEVVSATFEKVAPSEVAETPSVLTGAEEVVIKTPAKAISTYSKAENGVAEGKVEDKA